MAILKTNKKTLPSKIESNLQPWLLAAKNGLVGSFARKIARDLGTVHAAIAALAERPDGRKDNKTKPTAMTFLYIMKHFDKFCFGFSRLCTFGALRSNEWLK